MAPRLERNGRCKLCENCFPTTSCVLYSEKIKEMFMCKVFVTEDVHLCDICIKAFFFAHMCVFLSLIEKHTGHAMRLNPLRSCVHKCVHHLFLLVVLTSG